MNLLTNSAQKDIYTLDTANLVTPLPQEFNYLYDTIHLHCTEDGSDKYWSYYVVGSIAIDSLQLPLPMDSYKIRVILRWGKVNLLGQSEVKEFDNKWLAGQYISQRTKDKMKKGYKTIDATTAYFLRPAKNQVPVTTAKPAKLPKSQSFAWDL